MNKEKSKEEIKKPSMFNLRKWREELGYTTPEWEMYVKTSNDLIAILMAVSFSSGLFAGRG